MTFRYEANPPKITPDTNIDEAVAKFCEKIKQISTKCDAVHITDGVLGYRRISPLEVCRKLVKQIDNLTITSSLRVRDKTMDEIDSFVSEAYSIGINGVLILKGDPPQDKRKDSDLIPSGVVNHLNEIGFNKKLEIYLSISNNPDFSKIQKKIDAHPKGFITQVVQNISQVENLVDYLKPLGFSIIPILLFPSEKNQKSADFLGIDIAKSKENFEQFLRDTHRLTGDVLITSPNDYAGLKDFFAKL